MRPRSRGPSLLALSLAALAGCPGSGPTSGVAPVTSELPASGKLARPTRAPRAEVTRPQATPSPADDPTFPRAALFEVYRAEILGTDAERHVALEKNGLEDAQGKAVDARVRAYEEALQRFATERADEWSAFTDEVEQARVAKAQGSPPVDKK